MVEHRSANPKVLGSNPGAGFLIRNTSHLPLHSPPSINTANVYERNATQEPCSSVCLQGIECLNHEPLGLKIIAILASKAVLNRICDLPLCESRRTRNVRSEGLS